LVYSVLSKPRAASSRLKREDGRKRGFFSLNIDAISRGAVLPFLTATKKDREGKKKEAVGRKELNSVWTGEAPNRKTCSVEASTKVGR